MNFAMQILARVAVQLFIQYQLSKYKGVKKVMANQLAPGSKKSGEFIAFAGTASLAVISEGLESLGLPHLDPITALALVAGALVYGLIITLQKKFLGSSDVTLAKMISEAATNGIKDMAGQSVQAEVSVKSEPAIEATKPVEQVIFSDSQTEPPIPVNFAPVEKVVN